MKRCAMAAGAVILAAVLTGCSRKPEGFEIPTGTDVTVQKKDGVSVAGKLVEVQPQEVVLESRTGERTRVARGDIASLRATPAGEATVTSSASATGSTGAASPPPTTKAARVSTAGSAASTMKDKPRDTAPDPGPRFRDITIPAGTVLPVELKSAVSSDTSRIEDPVRGALTKSVTIRGIDVLPAGTALSGHVTEATRSGRVQGRARVAFRFNVIDVPGERMNIRTAAIARNAEATKKQDAAKIGGGAAGGAIIGGIIGGGSGAAKGAAIGGAAGTGVVLSTRGKEVRLGPGALVSVKLLEPVTVRVALK